MVDNALAVQYLDEWAKRVADKIILKETQYMPPAVAAMACVYAIRTLCERQDTVLRKETMAQILEGDRTNEAGN